MKYAYCPFDDNHTVDAIRLNIEDFHRGSRFDRLFREKFDDNIRKWTAAAPAVLSDVWRISQVYIFGHGAPKSNVIQPMVGNDITIAELANRVAASGLSRSHRTIKLFSCNGGEGGTDGARAGASMAAKLYDELHRNHGFDQVTVYGYLDSLIIGVDAAGHKLGEGGQRAKDIRVKFA
ncbi:MAG: hypothetical protein ACRD2O_04775 [Terriglobia bacterium]